MDDQAEPPRELSRFRSDRLHFEADVPGGWDRIEGDASVMFRETDRPPGEPASVLTIAVSPFAGEPSEFTLSVNQSLHTLLTDYLALDEVADTDATGRPRWRSLGTYRQGIFSFTVDSLALVSDDTAYLISIVCETNEHPQIADLCDAVFTSFEIVA